eukprot:TRINITY_DN10384_c0_g1_i2.p1 TRINITY_DN10384_c0_g1~~TRINITY_DN10384_c0_g1_i2.p1  ORF type:complete len:119 (-),score=6.32 TRINITY_DN10384_c0_g1_i2:44-400(-)
MHKIRQTILIMLPDNTQSEYSCPLLTASKSDFEDKGSVCSSLTLSLSVQLLLCDEEGNCETELVLDINPFVTNDDNILLHSVMEQLKNKGYSFKGAIISYYSAPVSYTHLTLPTSDLV